MELQKEMLNSEKSGYDVASQLEMEELTQLKGAYKKMLAASAKPQKPQAKKWIFPLSVFDVYHISSFIFLSGF